MRREPVFPVHLLEINFNFFLFGKMWNFLPLTARLFKIGAANPFSSQQKVIFEISDKPDGSDITEF